MSDVNLLISLSTLLDQNDAKVGLLSKKRSEELLQDCLTKLKQLSVEQQLNYLAMLYKIVGAEHFTGHYWQEFYMIYNDELRLRFGDILLAVKRLSFDDQKKQLKIAS